MHIILGAGGHVGSALAKELLARGEDVTVVMHSNKMEQAWQKQGAGAAIIDVHNTNALQQLFRKGKRLFLLNPPAPPATDMVLEERKTLQAILEAVTESGLEKIVAESTYGAQPGEGIGDLGVLYEMEQTLLAQSIPVSIIRAAYYMSNWDASLKTAREKGIINTLYPGNFALPMVAPQDIAQVAAELMTAPVENGGLHYVEGPEYYSPAVVAVAFSHALGKPVEAVTTPRQEWNSALQDMGFSVKAAKSMIAMTDITMEDHYTKPGMPYRGPTNITSYIKQLVQQSMAAPANEQP